MNAIELEGKPLIFEDMAETFKKMKVTMGQRLFYKPFLVPQSATTPTTGYSIRVTIMQSALYSIEWEDGSFRNDAIFMPNGVTNVYLDMKIVLDGAKPPVPQITLRFRITGPNLTPTTNDVTYKIN